MIPKVMKKFQTKHFSFGIVVNDMTPKEIVHLLYLGICFGTVVNDMAPKESVDNSTTKVSFETVINDMDQKNTMLFVKNI